MIILVTGANKGIGREISAIHMEFVAAPHERK
jgi:short-subunit dehydrogenase